MAQWSRKVISLVKRVSGVAQDYYPEQMFKMFIVNAPMLFSACWAAIKVWLDERVRQKINILGSGFYGELSKYIDEDQIPEFLGGKNKADCTTDIGPWNQYELVDSAEPGAQVGVRRKDDPHGRLITPKYVASLENPTVMMHNKGSGILKSNGAVIIGDDGSIKPNKNPVKSC